MNLRTAPMASQKPFSSSFHADESIPIQSFEIKKNHFGPRQSLANFEILNSNNYNLDNPIPSI